VKVRVSSVMASVLALSFLVDNAHAGAITLGTASAFGVLGDAGVTNTGPSLIDGSVSGSTGTPAVTGFPPGTVVPGTGTLYTTGPGSSTPFTDATIAYDTAIDQVPTESLAGTNLGGLTLAPGVYSFSSAAQLTGMLSLDAEGSDDASWTFQIPSSLISASASSVEIIDAGSPGAFEGSITWAIGSSATLGDNTTFLGTIISQAASTLDTGATIACGRVISLGAAVTLDDSVIDAAPEDCAVSGAIVGPPSSVTPEPRTLELLLFGLLAMTLPRFRRLRFNPVLYSVTKSLKRGCL